MLENYSTFEIPSFARAETYNFEANKATFEIYKELNQIAEEIEKCRARNT